LPEFISNTEKRVIMAEARHFLSKKMSKRRVPYSLCSYGTDRG